MTRTNSGKSVCTLTFVVFLALCATGCNTGGGRPSKVRPDNVDQRTNGSSVSITIPVTENDDAGSAAYVTTDGATTFFVLQEQFWGHVEVSTPPLHGTVSVSNLDIIYTSIDGYSGIDKFTYKGFVQNSDEEAGEAEVTVYLLGADAPLAQDDTVTLPPIEAMEIDVLDNDRNKKSVTVVMEIVSAPHLGTAYIHAPDQFNTKSTIFYSAAFGSSGIDEFTYRITGGSSAKVQVVVKDWGFTGFYNLSNNLVRFKINGSLVNDGTHNNNGNNIMVLRPFEGSPGNYYKSSSYTITVETDPPQQQPATLTVPIIFFQGTFVYEENPDPSISYNGHP